MKIIKNGTLMTMSSLNTIQADILIDDGKIVQIDKKIEVENAEMIDATGMLVLPGLVDAHSHIGGFDVMTGGQDLNEMVNPVTAELDAYDAIDPDCYLFERAIQTGITTSGIVPGSANVICGWGVVLKSKGESLEKRCLKHPFALKAAVGGNPKGVYGKRNQNPMTRMGITETMREYFMQVKEYMQKKEEALLDPSKKMPDFDLALEHGIPVLKKEIPLKIHVYQHDMITCIEIAKEFDFNITIDHALGAGDFLDELEAEKDRLAIIYGPIGAMISQNELHLVDPDCLKKLDERGIRCAMMTDGPARQSWMILAQCAEAVRFGMDPERALRMITINAAEILGCAERVGSIEVGKDADFAIFDGNPVVSTMARLQMTIIDGNIVYQRKEKAF